MQNLRGHPGFELKMSQNLQPLLALLKNSPAISAFLANEALAAQCLTLLNKWLQKLSESRSRLIFATFHYFDTK